MEIYSSDIDCYGTHKGSTVQGQMNQHKFNMAENMNGLASVRLCRGCLRSVEHLKDARGKALDLSCITNTLTIMSPPEVALCSVLK